jgi:hypothetical protein
MKNLVKISVTGLCLLSLTACTNMSLFKDSKEPEPAVPEEQTSLAAPSQKLGAADIRALLAGKSWKWQGPNNSGTTLYASDGTSLVEVDGKGTTSGKWETRDGQLCESFSPAPFLPKGGVPMSCQPFSGSGNVFQVGPATFSLAS